MTVPLLRIPLVCTFFAKRKELLFDQNMFQIFRAVLLEQGAWTLDDDDDHKKKNTNIPDLERSILST